MREGTGNKDRVVIVLGMHRSGTSVITKSLELLGVNLGDHLAPAHADNPKGYWEDLETVEINKKLLWLCKCSWHMFLGDQLRELPEDALSEVRAAAIELVRSRTAQFSPWGFKDPRTARLVPFWKQVVESAGFEPVFLIINRNPLSVAASLAARDQLSEVKSAYLWSQHTIPSFRETVGYRRVIVDYDLFLSEPLQHIARIANAFDLPVPNASEPVVKAYLEEFLTNDLRHTTHTLEDLRNSPLMATDVVSLYELSRSAANEEISPDSEEFKARLRELESNLEKFQPALNLVNDRDRRIEALQRDSRSLEDTISTLQTSRSLLENQAARLSDENKRLANEARESIESRERLTSLLNTQTALTESLQTSLAAKAKEFTELQIEHQKLDSRYQDVTHELVGIRSERDALQKRIQHLHDTINAIISSKSWRVTAPFRAVMLLVRYATDAMRTMLRSSMMWVWRCVPLSRGTKDRLRDLLFSKLTFLFRGSQRYANWSRDRDVRLDLALTRPTSYQTVQQGFVPHSLDPHFRTPTTRLIAFYLPQFHPIPENDAWWGKGFTEWTNVKPAKPQFEGHYQPHVPLDLGYYNLLDGETQLRQVEIAKQYGIGGFCFYAYWFGGKRLLEKPLDNYVADRRLDLPFCVCWANENWSRRWDGLENELLISQKHSAEDDIAFIACVARYLRDSRYIRIHGRPLLVIYRPSLFPDIRETAARWRDWCRSNNIGDIHLAYTQSFETVDPAQYGFDSAIEFPPNNASPPNLSRHVKPLREKSNLTVFDWRYYVKRSASYVEPGYSLFRSVCPSWDNSPRRRDKGTVFLHSNPPDYQIWLENAIRHTQAHRRSPDEHLVFVNAWNEWAEGAHLEPDEKYGYAWLTATRMALVNTHQTTSNDASLELSPRPANAR